jgi:tight adherence protein C
MSAEFSIPLGLALLGLVISDSEGHLFNILMSKSTALQDRTSVKSRLKQLGKNNQESYENYRIAQFSGCSIALSLLTALYFLNLFTFFSYLLFSALAAILVILSFERNLSLRCQKRMRDIESEFPALIELLTLVVGAGESPVNAFALIASRSHGYLSQEFSYVLADLEKGSSLTSALDELSRRVESTEIRRFVDSLIISISRGTPLVETLTHRVNESRNQERVLLLTAAGKAEVSMMIPVVFLILPISILFALFPSITSLNLFGV